MMASLFAGVSGLKNHQTRMNVIGNNIANINTVGFKGSRVNFQEALVQTLRGAGRPSSVAGGTNPIQLGLGMQVSTIDTLFQQGGIETTGQVTDLAIQGSGFFILGDNSGNRFYTRAGAFGFDANAYLVDPASGLFVLGKMADSNGDISTVATTGPIQVPFGQQDPARATEYVWLSNNLDAAVTDSTATLVDSGSSNVISAMGRATDGVGGTHTVSVVGNQAQNSSFTTNTGGALSLGSTLGALGVTDFSDFTITVDGTRTESVSGLDVDTTIQDLISQLNQIAGITAELTGGEITITRDMAGAQTDYWFQTSPVTAAGDVLERIFMPGSPPGTTITSSGGAATTFVVQDTFMPNRGSGTAAGPVTTNLELVFDETTGLVVGFKGLGGGGIEVATDVGGLVATAPGSELVVQTEETTHNTSINVYDSRGQQHTISLEFFKSVVPNRWEWSVALLGEETISAGGSGYVSFNGDGSLNTWTYNGGSDSLVINPNNGADRMSLRFDPGTVLGFDGLTGFASSGTHTASAVRQDGYGSGILEQITIDQSGNISGIFSNGVTRVMAQIMMADFFNQGGLRKAGNSMFQPTANSGSAIEGTAGAEIAGQLFSGALESSSVDIAQEFTNMIVTQRGFQVNARIITTSDNMLDELVNIKR